MAVSYMDFTTTTPQFTYTLSDNPFFKKNDWNVINALSVDQLNTLGNVSLLDIYLSKSNMIEPHIHQNASELVYCASGSAIVSIMNPFTKELLNFPIMPGQVANVPQGWWHYEIAGEDNTHLIAIFDAPVPQVIFGSDILRLTPASIFAHAYCLNEAKVKDALAPITATVAIGPPNGCNKTQEGIIQQIAHEQMQGMMNQGMMQQGAMSQGMSQPMPPQYIPGSYGGAYQNVPQNYPNRPIDNGGYSEQLEYPFHPIPFLYRNWDQP